MTSRKSLKKTPKKNFGTNQKNPVPATTAVMYRVRLFQASNRPRTTTGQWESTAWGRCRVVGRLGQLHADLLQTMLKNAIRYRFTDDGGLILLIDPALIRRMLSRPGSGVYSFETFKSLLEDLRTGLVEVEMHGHVIGGGLVDHWEYFEESAIRNPLPRTIPNQRENSGIRHLWRVRLGKPLVTLIQEDYRLYYDPQPIINLKHGISKAVARHILSHETVPNGGWMLDNLLQAVAGPLAGYGLRKYRRRTLEDSPGLSALGITIANKRVFLDKSTDSVPQTPDSVPQTPDKNPVRQYSLDLSRDLQGEPPVFPLKGKTGVPLEPNSGPPAIENIGSLKTAIGLKARELLAVGALSPANFTQLWAHVEDAGDDAPRLGLYLRLLRENGCEQQIAVTSTPQWMGVEPDD